MVVRILAGQLEGLRGMAVLIDVGNVWSCEDTIVATAAEDNPAAVTRPRMVTLCIGTVYLSERMGLALPTTQVHHPQISIVMPDVEVAIVPHGEQKVAAVW